MGIQDTKQKIPAEKRDPLPEEAEEGFTLHFGWLVLVVILLGLIWYFGWLKGFLYFGGTLLALMVFGMILDYFERDK